MTLSKEDNFEVKYVGKTNQFEGVIAHLRDLYDQNPILNGTLEITSPTKTHPEYPLQNLIEYKDLLDKCYWNFGCYNPKEEENWLLFDFKENHRISITAYTIRSGGSSHPKSWLIEGSNDQNSWTKIDEVHNCLSLNSPRATHTFIIDNDSINPETKSGFRFIRYVQLENMSPKIERKYRINLKAIEFFGNYIITSQ